MNAITWTTRIAVVSAALVILSAGILGYTALFDLFVSIGLFASWLGIFFPLLFDLAEVAAAVSVFNAKLQGEDDRFAWGMVILFTILGIVANISHATFAWWIGKIDNGQMILAIFATSLFPLSVALVTHLVKRVIARDIIRRTHLSTLAELTVQVNALTVQREMANTQVNQLLEVINKARENHAVWLKLSDFVGKDIKKDTSEWKTLRQLIWERDDKQCKKCLKDLSDGHYHCHHIVPDVYGGLGEPVNLVTLCEQCHVKIHEIELKLDQTELHFQFGASTLQKALDAKAAKKEQAMIALLDYLIVNPGASLAEAGQAIGRSKTTVGNYVDELTTTGKLHRNGKGWEVSK